MDTRARRGRRTAAMGLVLVAFAAAVLVACTPTVPAYCSAPAGADTHVWTGTTNDLWTNPANWDTNDVPGSGAGSADDYTCIPAGKSVRLGTPGQGVAIDLLAVDSRGTLQVTRGNALYLGGKLGSTAVRSYAVDFDLLQSTLGGKGELRVLSGGTFAWRSDGSGSSTQTTRRFNGVACPTIGQPDPGGPPDPPGRTYISQGATLLIDGQGVNLYDYRVIENHGTTTLANGGFIAANHGTTFENDGTFRITNAGGYYEGFIPGVDGHNCDFENGDPAPLSAFINNGHIVKCPTDTSCTGGTSTIAATFSGTGDSSVFAGLLSIAGNDTSATVGVGATLSTGACTGELCAPTATSADRFLQSVKMAGSNASEVAISEGTNGRATITIPDEDADYVADNTRMTFDFVLDATVLGTRNVKVGGSGGVDILHDPDGPSNPSPEVLIPNCVNQTTRTAQQRTCVDRAASFKQGNGDGVIVVRSDHNGTWRPR